MVSFFFKTYGCQANVADSQNLAHYLLSLGCHEVTSELEADVIIVNTCAVREKAEQKLFSYIGELAPLKLQRPYIAIGIIGCVASYKKKAIFERYDHVKFVHGAKEDINQLRAYLHDLVVQVQTGKQVFGTTDELEKVTEHKLIYKLRRQDRVLGKNFEGALSFDKLRMSAAFSPEQGRGVRMSAAFSPEQNQANPARPEPVEGSYRAGEREVNRSFINIMTGCNKYCAYCIVPFTRGREVSYPMQEIVERVERDVLAGAKEVTLIGQNVNSYIDPGTGARFPELLQRVAKIPGDFWVRFVSPHPQDMTEDLFGVMAAHRPKLTAYVHFPLQSGSTSILSAMGRNYTFEEFLMKIGWLRDRMPDAFISTDIIVGFPGETEEDFEATLHAMNTIRFDLIYSFIYSRRQFTRAYVLQDPCPMEIKSERLSRLQSRQNEIAFEQNSEKIGKNLYCLVEKRLERGKLLARTEGSLRVLIDGSDDLIGHFIMVAIESATPTHLCGRAA